MRGTHAQSAGILSPMRSMPSQTPTAALDPAAQEMDGSSIFFIFNPH